MLKKIVEMKNPEICIITPLLPNSKISKDTKISVKRNDTPFIWYSYTGSNNVAKNFELGLDIVSQEIKMPKYVIKIDNDTVWSRHSIDFLFDELEKSQNFSNKKIAYSYCSFCYKGYINKEFLAEPFDPERLKIMNYISSNSLFNYKILKEIGIVTDEKYRRLLDWALYLKLLNNGYYGCPSKGYFIALSSTDSISSGSAEDFRLKYNRIKEDFVI